MDDLAGAARSGRGQVVLINGPMSTGRTSLVQAIAERMQQSMAVLHASCAPAEQTLACGVITQLWHSTPLLEHKRTNVTGLLDRAVSRSRLVDDNDAELLHLLQGLCLDLHELATQRPVLVTIDDVRHADAASLAFLQQLIRRLRSYRVLLALTDDPHSDLASPPFLAQLHRQPHLRRIETGVLSHDGVAQWLRRHGDSAWTAEGVHRATGGNPLLVQALLTGGVAGYARSFAACLHRDDTLLLDVVRSLAIAGDEAARLRPHTLLDLPADQVRRAIHALEAAGLLQDGGFRHGAARTAILDDLPDELRASLHLRTAQRLQETGAAVTQVAAHLVSAGRVPPSWAVPVLIEAAKHSTEATGQATRYLELALSAQVDPRAAAATRMRLSQAAWAVNPAATSGHLTAMVNDLRMGRLDRSDAIILLRQLLWHGRVEECAEALALLQQANPSPTTGTELRDLEIWLSYTHPALAGRRLAPTSADTHLAVTPSIDPWLHSTAALTELLLRGQRQDGVEPALRVLGDLHLGRYTGWAEEAVLVAIAGLIRADRLETAAKWCARLGEESAGRPPAWLAAVSTARAEVALAQGDLAGAVDWSEAAFTHVPIKSWGVAVGLPLGSLILAYTRLGRFEEAAAQLAHLLPEAMFSTRFGLYYLHARGQHHLAVRHHHAALADFLTCGELIRNWGLDTADVVPWRASAAEAWLRLGNQDQARHLINGQLTRPTGTSARARGVALRLRAAAGPIARRPPLLLEALDLLEGCGDRFEQARTLADLANCYHALDEDRRARMVFRRALHLARSCGADLLHRELVAVGAELNEGDPDITGKGGWAGLTGSERRVAALAAIGYTNREIAGKLYITASTVEQHLTRVYRKLKVKHRRDLPVDLGIRTGQVTVA